MAEAWTTQQLIALYMSAWGSGALIGWFVLAPLFGNPYRRTHGAKHDDAGRHNSAPVCNAPYYRRNGEVLHCTNPHGHAGVHRCGGAIWDPT